MFLESLRQLALDKAELVLCYTIKERTPLHKLRDLVKISTATYGRSIIICDSFLLNDILPIFKLPTRGGITVAVVDLTKDIWKKIPKDIPILEPHYIDINKAIEESLILSEVLEIATILRLPLEYLEKNLSSNSTQSRENKLKREVGTFYRDWRFAKAWVLDDILLDIKREEIARDIRKLILRHSIDVIMKNASSKTYENVVVCGTELSVENSIYVEVYSMNSIKDIVLELSRNFNVRHIHTINEDLISVLADTKLNVQVHKSEPDRQKLRDYINVQDITGIRRTLSAFVFSLCSRLNRPFIILSNYRIIKSEDVFEKSGKYDVRQVFGMYSISDIPDVVLSKCDADSLRLLASRLPDYLILCVQDNVKEITIDDLEKLRNLKGVVLILPYDVKVFSFLKMLNIETSVVEPSIEVLDYLAKAIESARVRVILVDIPKVATVKIVEELCDSCGACLSVNCGKIVSKEGKVRIEDSECCRDCFACRILCSRGAILVEVPEQEMSRDPGHV